MKTKILMAILVSLLVISVVSSGIPAGPKAANQGQGAAGEDPTAPPEIEMGMFINRPLSSPPWYPYGCEDTDTYRWAPTYHWANPELDVLVNPTGISTDETVQIAAVAAVTKAFGQWNGASTDYSAAVSRNDSVGPSLNEPDEDKTVSWGTIDDLGGTIGITYFWYNVRTKELIDCDIVLDKDEIWLATDDSGVHPEISDPANPYPTTGQFDVWNVVTHEAGHTLVLSDLRSPKDGALTMHAYTWPGDSLKRTLGTGDTLGIQEIYGE